MNSRVFIFLFLSDCPVKAGLLIFRTIPKTNILYNIHLKTQVLFYIIYSLNTKRRFMTTYQLTITKKQAKTIQAACELYERLHAGQWFALEYVLPYKDEVDLYELERAIGALIEPHCDTDKMNFERISGDIMQVIRHHLAWEEHPEGGDTVSFGTPIQLGSEPLAKIVTVEE